MGPKGIPKLLLELPVWSVPGLALLALFVIASGGGLWESMLRYVSLGMLDEDNIWSFVVTIGVGSALALGLLLEPLGELVGMGTDRLLGRPGPAVAFEWLEAHEEHTAEFAEKRRAQHRLCNSLCVADVVGAIAFARAGRGIGEVVALIAVALVVAGLGAVMKTRWLAQTERLRAEALRPRPPRSIDAEAGSPDR